MKKVLTYAVLPIVIIALAYFIYSSIMEPVRFNKEKAQREAVAIQQLKDIRTLEVAYKSVYAKFTADPDSLKEFYNNGEMEVVMQIGSLDDSVAVANTENIRKANRKITNEQLFELYKKGEKRLVFSIKSKVPVKESILQDRPDFDINRIGIIPFSDGAKVQMDEITKQVSGVDVPLFEAKMPYDDLLKGMDRQLIVNLKAERSDTGRYPGLMVGSIDNPNNNAGNWE